MTGKEFGEVTDSTLAAVQQVLCSKADEYAFEGDRLSNFKRAGQLNNEEPEQALLGMLTKHIVSIYDMVDSLPEQRFDWEMWHEKTLDIVNYMILLRALVQERGAPQKSRENSFNDALLEIAEKNISGLGKSKELAEDLQEANFCGLCGRFPSGPYFSEGFVCKHCVSADGKTVYKHTKACLFFAKSAEESNKCKVDNSVTIQHSKFEEERGNYCSLDDDLRCSKQTQDKVSQIKKNIAENLSKAASTEDLQEALETHREQDQNAHPFTKMFLATAKPPLSDSNE